MYKTIRHGENSLQYTILPQTDDFRIEGKLTSASCSSSSGKSKSKRSVRRRSFFAYLGLLFVCTVIIGAILVPFLVSAECLPNPSDWFLKTQAAFTGTTRRFGTSSASSIITPISQKSITDARQNSKLIQSTIQSYPMESSSEIVRVVDSQIDLGPAKASPSFSTETSIDAMSTQNSELLARNNFVAEVRLEGVQGQMAAAVGPTIVVTTAKNTDQNKVFAVDRKVLPTLIISSASTMKPIALSGGQNITGRVMQVPLLKSASKKPIIPPVLAKTNSLGRESVNAFIGEESNKQDITKKDSNEPKDWISSHWPYIDPSTYFQWTGYKTEDSVLLPAILGVALIVAIMIVALILVARNKRKIVSSVRKRNRNDVEEAGEDNTTLLTNTNLSDEE